MTSKENKYNETTNTDELNFLNFHFVTKKNVEQLIPKITSSKRTNPNFGLIIFVSLSLLIVFFVILCIEVYEELRSIKTIKTTFTKVDSLSITSKNNFFELKKKKKKNRPNIKKKKSTNPI